MYLGSHDHKGQLRIGRRQGGGADWGLDLEIGYRRVLRDAKLGHARLLVLLVPTNGWFHVFGSTSTPMYCTGAISLFHSQYKNSWV